MSENINNNNLSIQETKEFKLLLNLLEKEEQILSIINLPESSISKYNTLKKMTYDLLNIEFKPLEKIPLSSPASDNKSSSQANLTVEILYILHFLNIKKTLSDEYEEKDHQDLDSCHYSSHDYCALCKA